MTKLARLAEAADAGRLDTAIKNLETTIKTITSVMEGGVVPSSDHLKSLWLSHEKLGEAYDLAEKLRVKK